MFALECVRIVVLGVKSNRVKLRFLFQLLHLHPKIEVLSTVYLTIEPHTENGTHTHFTADMCQQETDGQRSTGCSLNQHFPFLFSLKSVPSLF